MLLAHKIELNCNNKQATYCAKASGAARKGYNWALNAWNEQYAAGLKPTESALRKQLNSIKRKEFPWMLEVTKNAPQMAIIQLGQAFKNFFAKRADHPQFRKKWIDDRFTLSNDQFDVKDARIRIPHLGWVRMREPIRFAGKIMSATISRCAHKWMVSLTVEMPETLTPAVNESQGAVGVDVGISSFATLSTGEKIIGPKAHKAALSRLRRLSQSLSRKQKKSKNRKKACMKLARLHRKISNIRSDAIHQLTTQLTENFSCIGIEDLNVKGMMKNRRLARSIADMGFHELKRQLIYKTALKGKVLVIANRFYASSKTCCRCQSKMASLPLKIREWTCPNCGAEHDRDVNAAKNLEMMAVSSTVTACGASSNGIGEQSPISYGVVKQEFNIKPIQPS